MLPKFSVKKPFTIAVAVIMIIVLGIVSFMNLSTDLLPKMDLPYAIIMTTYPGATPEKVELSVTKPIEQVVATVSNVKKVNSVSSENSSMVIIEFTDGVNMDSALIELNNQLDLIKSSFDDSISSPTIIKLNPDMMPVMVSAISIDDSSIVNISDKVNNEIMPLLEKTNGVASVTATGLIEEQIKVKLNQEKIDEINSKVLANIDAKLADTEKELNNARSQIEQGKQAIDEQTKVQSAKLVDGLSSLDSGKKQLEKAECNLKFKHSEVSFLSNTLSEFSKTLDTQEKEIQSQIDSIGNPDELNAQEQAIVERLTSFKNIIKDNKEQNNSKVQELNLALSQIEEGQSQLSAQKATVTEQEKQLELAKITMSSELNKAYTSLAISQTELDKGQKEFETAREEAYKNASLDGIITQDMISNILIAENLSMPAGSISSGNDSINVKVGEKFKSIDEIKNLTIFSFDIAGLENVTLEQLADISFSNNSASLYSKVNGNDGVVITFQKQSTASTTDVSNDIKETISNIEKDYPGVHFTTLMDQGVYINIVIDSVINNLLSGGALAVLILLLFLRDIKPTFIISLSIPISLTFAIALMYFTGVTINIISLSGLALGVGMLVDNSIVVIENIYRLRGQGLSVKKAAIEGAASVAGAIFASTLTTICVFLPIVFIQGISRQLFSDMGLTIAYSLIASLIIALTLVPAMASGMFKKEKNIKHRIFDFISNIYSKILSFSLKIKPLVLILALALLGYSGYLAINMGTSFIPESDSNQMSLSLTMPKDSTFDDMKETSNTVIDKLLTISDIESIGAISSSNSGMMSTANSSSKNVNMYLILKDNKILSNAEIKNQITTLTSDLNCDINVSTSNMDLSSFSGSGIEVVIKGSEINTLQTIAKDIEKMLSETDGFIDIDNGIQDTSKELKITVNKNEAMKYGLTVAQIYQDVSQAIKAEQKSTILSVGDKEYPIVVVKSDKNLVNESNLTDLELNGTQNQEEVTVKLSDIATIDKTDTLSSISHDNNQRYIQVTASVDSEHNIGLLSRDFEEKLKNYTLPSGYTAEIQGESETINQTLYDLVLMIALAVLFIYLIMVAQFQSLLAPFIIMFTIPLAFTGGLFALALTHTEISIIAMLGFLVLAGIVVNNGIVLIDYINQLRASGMEKKEAIVLAGKTRLRPILMTALTTILGLSTLALGMGSGSEMLQPLGIVAIGGLIYSTILTLVVVPCMYDMFHRKKFKNRNIE